MGEFVGVNPVNLAELAKRLQRLHEVLARNGPIIQQKMRQWDSEVSFTQLPRLTDSALNDTRDMNARTTKAHGLASENGWNPAILSGLPLPVRRPLPTDGPGPIGPRSPYVQLDWDAVGQSGYQAEQDVQALKDALAGKDPEAVRVGLSGVREHLTQHLDDKPYLAAFWAQAGPLALQAARALYNRTGASLFSAESMSILRALGSSLAAASQMRVGTGKDGRPLLSPETRAAITKSSDPWSVGMLFKYGPDGKSWDSRFLAEVTRSMLDARAAGKVQVPTPSGHGGILDQDRALYQKRLADFDPVLAVMDRATQNGQAARHVLGDPDSGLKYAKMLVGDDWRTPGVKVGPYGKASGADPSLTVDRIDLTSHAAEFLKRPCPLRAAPPTTPRNRPGPSSISSRPPPSSPSSTRTGSSPTRSADPSSTPPTATSPTSPNQSGTTTPHIPSRKITSPEIPGPLSPRTVNWSHFSRRLSVNPRSSGRSKES